MRRPDPRGRKVTAAILAVGLFCALFTCGGPSAALRKGQAGAIEEGMATYYAPRLAGHKTANGERYDPRAFTAAHPVLPFGTRVRVTRTGGPAGQGPGKGDDGRSVVVRINDRCASGKKIIDLSEAAARRLGMMKAGIVRVRLQVLSGHLE